MAFEYTATKQEDRTPGRINEPPGGILIWILIFLELFTFMIALTAFTWTRLKQPALFAQSQSMLNPFLGTLNTLFLLTSGYFMARTIHALHGNRLMPARRFIIFTLLFGVLFVVIKTFEYHVKIRHGIGLEYNIFFTFYWLLTGFHLIHVLAGLFILFILRRKLNTARCTGECVQDMETGAAFWHMCDLIWMMLFPILYLIR